MTTQEPTLAEQIAWLESDVKAHPNYGHILASLRRLQAIEQDGWIKCSERLPEDGVTVLVQGGIAQPRGGVWYSLTGIEYPGRPIQWEVTHWRPLPPLPRSE